MEKITIRTVNREKEDVSAASGQCARALFSMTSLRSLEIDEIEIDDEFLSVMAEVAGGSQVKEITKLSS